MPYYKNGESAELEFKHMMEKAGRHCKMKNDTNSQFSDIDLVLFSKDWKSAKSISVKEQHLADEYETFLFETRQVRTHDLKETAGNLLLCEANLYAVCSPTLWFVFDAAKLKQWLVSQDLPEIRTTYKTEELNRKYKGHNCYDRTINVKVTFNELRKCPAFIWETPRKKK